MRVLVLGAGLMGAQIGCEYAFGGHDVTLVARNLGQVKDRVEAAFTTAESRGLVAPEDIAGARRWARRSRHVGPFQAIALGGETSNRSGANLLPELATAFLRVPDLGRLAPGSGSLKEVATRRDRALARELLEERNG